MAASQPVLLELKRPGAQNATLRGAFNQVQTYVQQIPDLFTWNQVTVISDGVQARAGTFTAAWEHYAPWKTIDGRELAPPSPNAAVLAASAAACSLCEWMRHAHRKNTFNT